MRQDKHKAKRSARYKKQHGIGATDSVSKGKKTKGGKRDGDNGELNLKETLLPSVNLKDKTESIQQHEIGLIENLKSWTFSKRKVKCNWSKYEDFTVEDVIQEEKRSTRGADLQDLISKSGGAASQLRMKDEKWDEDSKQDDSDSEVSDLFKVDFREVADRLQAVPLHERLGVPEKYFEKDVLDLIKADAANHAARIQQLHEKELALRMHMVKQSAINNSVLRDRGERGQQQLSSSRRDNDIDDGIADPIKSSDNKHTSGQSTDVQFESKPDSCEAVDRGVTGMCLKEEFNTASGQGTTEERRTAESSAKSAELSHLTEAPSEVESKDAVEDLEDWLDGCLESNGD